MKTGGASLPSQENSWFV